MAVVVVKITPSNRKNGPWLLSMGITGLFICLWLAGLWWHQARYLIIVLVLSAVILTLLGTLKLMQPRFSLLLGEQGLKFIHRNGCWQSAWDNIVVAGQPRVDGKELPYVGLSLRDLDSMADAISPRLANKLLHEQQDLLDYSRLSHPGRHGLLLDDCEPYQMASGELIKGPVGGWLHRCERLKEPLGYHLYIPSDMLDRPPQSFLELFNQCRQPGDDGQQE